MRKFLPLALFVFVVGCGDITPAKNPDMVEITGSVTLKGQPLSDVTLNLQPTGTGTMATIPVQNGKFKASVTPGKYTYFFSEGRNVANLNRVPKAYQAGAMDRQVELSSGSTLDIKMD